LLTVYEKYCGQGKNIMSNVNLELNQFHIFMTANHLYTKTITSKKVENIFNKIKGLKKSNYKYFLNSI